MSLTFKFQKPNDNEPDKQAGKANPEKEIENHSETSAVRNLHLVDASGKQTFHNYAYLVSGEFLPDDNTLTLVFTSATITLNGHNLEKLFEDFMAHAPKSIACMDKRYERTKNDDEIFVTEIIITQENK